MGQLRRRGITSAPALAALEMVPRELFLPARMRDRAYEDRALPIGAGQTCSQPWIVAAVVQALELAPGGAVLEIGAGSGYLAAVLRSAGAGRVVTVELIPELAARARSNLNRAGVEGVEVRLGDGARGAPGGAPFEAVVISAVAAQVPPRLPEQVAPGGRLLCPLRMDGEEHLWVHRRLGDGWQRTDLGPCRFVPLRRPDGGEA
ncbi:MAG: protein-L-isoaspartate(D-aspartate) O-methyltransferase [Candidatus Dormibacteria bacterium]